MNFTPLANGRVEGFCLVRSVECKTGKNGAYLDLTLGDKEGEINAKIWRYSVSEHGEYEANQLVKVRGTIRDYNGSDQLSIEQIRPALESDGVRIEDYVKTAAFSGEEMYGELYRIAENFTDTELKTLVTAILEDHRLSLLCWPAAYKLHHAVRGGLLMHTLSIVRLAEGVCAVYPFVDRELLLTGAILHDIAKIQEFCVNDSGIADNYSVEGNLLGHLAMGAMTIDAYAKRLGLSKKTAVLVEHMILSHHGEPEFGAAVRPMFMEAELLSELDLMDSRVYEMRDAVQKAEDDDFSGRVWALDNRKLFRHGRTDLSEEPKLF